MKALPATLVFWVNDVFLGDDRPYDGAGMVSDDPCVNPCGALREAAYGRLKAQWQIFHGEAANLCVKAHSLQTSERTDTPAM